MSHMGMNLPMLALHHQLVPNPSIVVVIASGQQAKAAAAKGAFIQMFPMNTFNFKHIRVPSMVSDQPMSDEETLKGATNRVHTSREVEPNADYWIGIEGGCCEFQGALQSFAWVVVMNKEGKYGKARSAATQQPEEVAELVRAGMQLRDADEMVFMSLKREYQTGSIALLTEGISSRVANYSQAVILALIPFKNPKLTFPQ